MRKCPLSSIQQLLLLSILAVRRRRREGRKEGRKKILASPKEFRLIGGFLRLFLGPTVANVMFSSAFFSKKTGVSKFASVGGKRETVQEASTIFGINISSSGTLLRGKRLRATESKCYSPRGEELG